MEHIIVSDGSPYDHKKPLTCPHCIDRMWALRKELCDKYGWDYWPDDLMGVYK